MNRRLRFLLLLMVAVIIGSGIFLRQRNSLGTAGSIRIIGDETCQTQSQAALDYVRERSPEHYVFVDKYIGAIQCVSQGSGINVYQRPPVFHPGDVTRDAGIEWYAGTIVHDACHIWLYDTYARRHAYISEVPRNIWSGKEAEMKCMKVQEAMLRNANAPDWVFESLDDARNSEYWNQSVWW